MPEAMSSSGSGRDIESLFILSAREDKAAAAELKEVFGGETFRRTALTLDDILLPGDTAEEALVRIYGKVDAVLAILSRSSVRTPFVTRELLAARAYSQERGRPQLIALNITGDDLDLPRELLGVRVIDIDMADPVYQAAVILDTVKVTRTRLKAIEAERSEEKERVEDLAATYIEGALVELAKSERSYRSLAYFCYVLSYLTLGVSVCVGAWRLWSTGNVTPGWPSLTYQLVAAIIIFTLLFSLSRFSFMLGKAFMTESLRNADRRHAISFGHFYLRAFGHKVEWSEIKEAFQHWNIDKGSYFTDQSSADYDPSVAQRLADSLQSLKKALS